MAIQLSDLTNQIKASLKLNKKNLSKLNICLISLYILRIVLCCLPQHGYLHPDEFFQFTEPMAVKSSGIKGHLTWEWNEKQPIRSVVFPYLFAGLLMKFLKYMHGSKTFCTYLVLMLPRLVFILCSFSLDCLLYKCCTIAKIAKVKETLLIFASSYVTLVYFGHTFTNTIECWLFAAFIFLIFKSIRSRKDQNIQQIAFVLTLGIWNRPTFILFALYPIFYWSTIENHQSRKLIGNLKILGLRLFKLISLVKIFSIFLIAIDTLFYQGDYVISTLSSKNFANFDLKRLVITPVNFVQFNAKFENPKVFGVNPLYLHFVLNLQLLFCFLGLYLIKDVLVFLRNILDKKSRTLHLKTNFRNLLVFSTLPPLIILSLVPHQEPRFLTPLLFPLVLLYGSKCFSNKFLLTIWILFNLVLTIFYGFIHQAGVTRSMFLIKPELSKSDAKIINIIYSSTYLPPQHLLGFTDENLKNYSSKINFYDLSVAQFPEELMKTLNTIKSQFRSQRHQTYLVAPSTINKKLSSLAKTLSLDFKLFRQIFPTFDFEHFELPTALNLSELKNKFSTNIWLIN